MEWLAQWVSALGSIGALIAAIWAGLSAKGLYRVELGRDEAVRKAAAREDAARVHAWVAEEVPEGRESGDTVLVVANGASTPLYDIRILSSDALGVPQPRVKLHMLPPGEFMLRRQSHKPFQWHFPEPTKYATGRLLPVSKHQSRVVKALYFTDARGARWERAEHGELVELGAAEEEPSEPAGLRREDQMTARR
jgi:hypothetical protein